MEINKYLEHTLLKPDTSGAQITRLCEEAKQYNLKAVCVPPFFVKHASNQLENSLVRLVTVVGYPLGYSTISAKIEEVKRAVDEGVHEVDVVANIAAIKDNKWGYTQNDLDSATRAAHLHGKLVKIIVEADLLTNEELKRLCELCSEIGVNYIKTSSGYHNQVATPELVRRIKSYILNPDIKIKASGGIRTFEQAQQLVEAGATRLGTSSAMQILGVKVP
jgi:deoxyribose-phosphate aldolase